MLRGFKHIFLAQPRVMFLSVRVTRKYSVRPVRHLGGNGQFPLIRGNEGHTTASRACCGAVLGFAALLVSCRSGAPRIVKRTI